MSAYSAAMSDQITATAVEPSSAPPEPEPSPFARRAQFWRSPVGQPGWARPSLLLLSVAATVVYAWKVGHMQLHLYYGPGVKTMSSSWSAWLFGAYDPQLATTFDKVPGTFWLQALSARVFGYSSWAVLLPSLLASVAAILLLYRIAHRWAGPVAGLAAAGFYATTPIVAALARTQIPDPLLIVLLLAAAASWQSAVDTGRLGPLLWTGVWVGLAFQAKMAQAWLAWLIFGGAYLVFAPTGWGRRIGQLGEAGVLSAAVSLVWVVAMSLIPASSRPWIDGSVDNSVWSMAFGYNGLNRYALDNTGAEALGIGGPPGRSEGPAWLYLFRDGVVPQIGWLYPLALVGLIAGYRALGGSPVVSLGRSVRVARATCLMWTLWLGVHTVAFAASVKAHTFYNLALAPALAALAGVGAVALWTAYRSGGPAQWLLPLTVAVTAWWGSDVAGRFPNFAPWLSVAIVAAGAVAVAALTAGALSRRAPGDPARPPAIVGAAGVVAVAAFLLAPVTWTLSVTDNVTVSDAHRPAAGPPSRETATILSGRLLRMLPAAEVDRITAYVKATDTGERYPLAVQWAPQAGQFLLRDVVTLPVGGFTAQVPTISPERLGELASLGQLRYALLDGPDMKGKPTPDYSGFAVWVRGNCRALVEFTQPLYTLYDCRRN